MINQHIISMPDKWKYPWYAAWDLAFHTIALSTVAGDFAKDQLDMMLREYFLHPTGQIPAYEWNFSDVNPPVHAWATIFLYRMEQALHGKGDYLYHGDNFKIECPTGSGRWMNLFEVARDLADRRLALGDKSAHVARDPAGASRKPTHADRS